MNTTAPSCTGRFPLAQRLVGSGRGPTSQRTLVSARTSGRFPGEAPLTSSPSKHSCSGDIRERWPSEGCCHAGGMVVNVHTNGPQVYAPEIYTLRDAVPGTYQVTLNVFPTSLDCTGTALAFPTATLVTNARGNGQADVKFTPEDVAGFRGMTF